MPVRTCQYVALIYVNLVNTDTLFLITKTRCVFFIIILRYIMHIIITTSDYHFWHLQTFPLYR